MELYQLKSFVVLAEEGGVRAAARRLHLSPSALSGQIKALEENCGVALFSRERHGMLLTEAGEALHAKAQEVLAAAAAMDQTARKLRDEVGGDLRVGVINQGRDLPVAATVATLGSRYPALRIELVHAATGAVRRGLLNGELDLGFLETEADKEPTLWLERVGTSHPVLIYPAAWHDELAGPDWAPLARHPWIFASPDCSYFQLIRREAAARGLDFTWKFRTDDEATVVDFVARGLGLAIADPDFAAPALARGQIYVWEHYQPAVPVFLAALPRRREEKPLAAFRETLQAQLPDHGPAANGVRPPVG